MRYLKIPKERIGVLIGHNGETKKEIEKISETKIDVDSRDGEITIDDSKAKDPLTGLKTEDVIRAIGRGFSPQHALKLFNEDIDLYIFDIHDYVGKKESHIRRLKSRVIGREGKTKRVIENLTGAHISIYGHTVSIISDIESMAIAKRAVDMLLSGSKHSKVYRFIERGMKKLKMEQML
ncbi:MAG: RNA-processing protein [Thermoplasmata archaeon]|nr:MAG: RNA-processing protein [Thermoplasmata archaeon]RLF35236.1 MAG: RNA-processing protein [Thermoplasmata archaeon]